MTKLMIIIGSTEAIEDIEKALKERAQKEWYNSGKKEFDADVKVFDLREMESFHLG